MKMFANMRARLSPDPTPARPPAQPPAGRRGAGDGRALEGLHNDQLCGANAPPRWLSLGAIIRACSAGRRA
jgi:hypothetical protein